MAEHTPGPWLYDGCVQIVEAERPHMRICFLPSDHDEYASSKANARLIAAAPDLLEALIAISDQLERIGDTRPHKDGQFIDDARAAIAKATGDEGGQ